MAKRKGIDPAEIKRMIKFGITGVGNTLVDMGVSTGLLLLGGNVYAAKAVGYAVGMLNSYLLNRSWTFRSKERFFSPQLVRFIVTNLVVLGTSMLLIKLFTAVLLLPALWAMLLSTGCTLVLNFIISRLWVFR